MKVGVHYPGRSHLLSMTGSLVTATIGDEKSADGIVGSLREPKAGTH